MLLLSMAKVRVWFDSQNANVFAKRFLILKKKFDKAAMTYIKENPNSQVMIEKKGIIFGTNTGNWNVMNFRVNVLRNFDEGRPIENRPLDVSIEKLKENKLLLTHIEGPLFDVIRAELKKLIKDIENFERVLISRSKINSKVA